MCGIVGYIGYRKAADVLLDGLYRLEYRGYDSAGVAIRDLREIQIEKEVGKVAELDNLLKSRNFEGTQGIGHTRWATHGGVTAVNAHPHCDSQSNVALVHNGIIENYLEIKEDLEKEGVTFNTQTDTEVVAQLLAKIYQGDAVSSLIRLSGFLEGSYALVILVREIEDKIYCIRKGSPLVLGKGKKESFCASDVPALLPYTKDFIYLNDGEIAELSQDNIQIWDSSGQVLTRSSFHVDWDVSMSDKDGYPHFMLKEINEQSRVIRDSLLERLQDDSVDLSAELKWSHEDIHKWKKIHIVACGTSYYAALIAERLFENVTECDIRVDVASEYRYRKLKSGPDTLAIFVSQSGETADTLAAERKARTSGACCLAVTNVPNSTLAREVDHVLLLKAGPEVGVAATKTFTGQLCVLYLLALYLGRVCETLSKNKENRLVQELRILPFKVDSILEDHLLIRELAEKYANARNFLFLGRGNSFPVALEGALKLKEISYLHAEAYAAGEMKHGPIALLDPEVPVVVVIPRDELYDKVLSNIQEARARSAPIIAVATSGDQYIGTNAEDIMWIPVTEQEMNPFLAVIPLQLFAYYVARYRGCDIDQPRNLAKSVTVE
ncbi:MAG: glutamine--fructose-6-phosphate transaminase (isomerizing) [Synergistales bacterium]|nr:glutamine--fructose-6-phosphate transaminase (isomerizing) [Synergistales bacterium]